METKTQLGFYLDLRACIGCKACQVACRDKNMLPDNILWRRVQEQSSGKWEMQEGELVPSGISVYHLSISCQHCEKPACKEVCPVDAISKKEDGIVHVDQEACIGCESCFYACPFETPRYSSDTGKMSKCDMCADLREQEENPACVDACPLRALDWGDMSELRKKYGNLTTIEPLPEASHVGPSMIFTPPRKAKKS